MGIDEFERELICPIARIDWQDKYEKEKKLREKAEDERDYFHEQFGETVRERNKHINELEKAEAKLKKTADELERIAGLLYKFSSEYSHVALGDELCNLVKELKQCPKYLMKNHAKDVEQTSP